MKKAYVIGAVLLLSVFILCLFPKNKLYADTDLKNTLIEKTKEVINEKNYFQSNANETFLVGYDICYDIYSDGTDYFVVLPDENIHYSFSKYENNFYYTGNEDYESALKICSGSFCIENTYIPDYNKNNNLRITCFLDYETVLSSIISNYKYDSFYTIYLLNSFPWDKSNYLNGSEQLNVMIIDDNKNVLITYCYFSVNGWNIGTPGFKFSQSEYPELVEKYKNTAVYRKNNIIRN